MSMSMSMSMWKVEVVSHESIKPSSPTPPHLRSHQLSWMDQMSCPDPFKLIFFYCSDLEPADEALSILKSSLSECLTLFYPAAGRLNPDDVSVVDCDDQGVELFEARASADAAPEPLSKLLDRGIDYDDLAHFLPPPGSSPALLSLQVTVFAPCGGVSVGGCFSHKLFDGASAAEFVNAWASVARNGRGGRLTSPAVVLPPLFDAASRFVPPSPLAPPPLDLPSADTPKETVVAKRFVFEEPAIESLRKSPPGDHPPPSKTVAVTALLWRCCIRAREALAAAASDGPKRRRAAWVALVLVNLRGKAAEPPLLPDNLMGNVCGMAAATADASNAAEKRGMEEDLRSGIRRVDAEMVRRLQGADGLSVSAEAFQEATGKLVAAGYDDIDYFMLSSWSGFPLYEADFGWGRPAWVAPHWTLLKNVAVSMGRGEVGGLEVWVSLEEDMMAEFQRDQELISYTRPLLD